MDNNTKNMLVLGGAAVAGGWGGSWAAAQVGARLGVNLGPWGAAVGAMIGSMLGTSIAKKIIQTQTVPGLEATFTTEPIPESTSES